MGYPNYSWDDVFEVLDDSQEYLRRYSLCFLSEFSGQYKLSGFDEDHEPYNVKPDIGYVYVSERDGLYKIGKSKTAVRRGSKFGNVLLSIPTNHALGLEKDIHTAFSHLNVMRDKYSHGYTEWFSLTDLELDFLKNLSGRCN